MSEKRIYCIEVSGECKYLLNVNRPALAHLCESTQGLYCTKNFCWKPITKDACKNCKEGKYQGFTRKQVIHKIAKAICRTDGESCITCGFNCNEKGCKEYLEFGNYITQAEVVLEDILEGHDDEQ
ncbi:hypothetical protein [Candidatus Avelusimicrobium fimicolum]|uniref:hypothetical protein n=1 Tax=Candidatus Avelusimicrobium fimicolum TaxID=3416216 RepID=UPI003D0F084F